MTTRERILHVSFKHFLLYGYDLANLNAIADEVEIKKPSIYHHFSSKEEILYACIQMIHHGMLDKIDEILSKTDSPKGQLTGMVSAMMDFHASVSYAIHETHLNPISFLPILSRSAAINEELYELVSQHYAALQQRIVSILVQAQNLSQVSPYLNKDLAASEMIARIEGCLMMPTINKRFNQTELSRYLLDQLWGSVSAVDHDTQNKKDAKKRKPFDYKSIDLARKW